MRFLLTQLAVFAAVIISVLLTSGTLLSGADAWKGLGLIALIVLGLLLAIRLVARVFTSGPMDPGDALTLAVVVVILAFGSIVLMMGLGREWLYPVLKPFKTAGMWWPIAAFGFGTLAYWWAQPESEVAQDHADSASLDDMLA